MGLTYSRLPPCPENNFSIYVSHYEGHIPHGIDTEDDLNAAIDYLSD